MPVTPENSDLINNYRNAFIQFRTQNINIYEMNVNQFEYLKALAKKLNAEVPQKEPVGNTTDKGKTRAQDTQVDLTQEETGQPENTGTNRRFDPNWEITGQPESSGTKRPAFIDLTQEETEQPESSEPKRQKTGGDQTSDNQNENTNKNQRTDSIIDDYPDTGLDNENAGTGLDNDNADISLVMPDYINYFDELLQLIKDDILNIGFML